MQLYWGAADPGRGRVDRVGPRAPFTSSFMERSIGDVHYY